MKKLRKIVAADEDVKRRIKLSSLQDYASYIVDYLRLNQEVGGIKPAEYFVDVDDSGAVGVYAQYDNGFELTMNPEHDGHVFISFGSDRGFESKEIQKVATWLFNLNIDGAETQYKSIQKIVDTYGLKGIDDLTAYDGKDGVKSSTALRRRNILASEYIVCLIDKNGDPRLPSTLGYGGHRFVNKDSNMADKFDNVEDAVKHGDESLDTHKHWGVFELDSDRKIGRCRYDNKGNAVTAGCHGKKSVKSGSSLGDNQPSVKQLWDFLIESGWAYDACKDFGIDDPEDEEAMRALTKAELMMWIYDNDERYNNFVEYFDIEED